MEHQWHRIRELPVAPRAADRPPIMIDLNLSPYDVPDAVRAYRTPADELRIEFQYADGQEPERLKQVSDFMVVREGRHTSRIFGLEIDLQKLPVPASNVTTMSLSITPPGVDKSIAEVLRFVDGTASGLEVNRRMVGEVIRQRREEIARQLTPG